MSPKVLRAGHLRLTFFSREEARMHVHVVAPDGETRLRLEPVIEVAHSYGLSDRDVRASVEIAEEHQHVIRTAWIEHFGR